MLGAAYNMTSRSIKRNNAKDTFFHLPLEKRHLIEEVAVEEFAENSLILLPSTPS
jgi:hypothetical protein